MKEVFLGDAIRQRRLDMGLTQEQLSEGICEQATICRFERGTQTPSHNRIKTLLQRLGLPGDRYFALLSLNEEQIKALQDDINACKIRFHLSNDKNRSLIRKQVWERLTELENIMEPDDQITRQYILSTKVAVDRPNKPYPLAEQLEMLMGAIRLTVPRFELEEIGHFRFSGDELGIIAQIAHSYSKMGQSRRAIDIYQQLYQYVERNNRKLPTYAEQFCLISSNYAIELGKEKRFEEAVEIANRGWHACVEHRHYLFLPFFLTVTAEYYCFLGDKEKSIEFYRQAYYLFKSIHDEYHLEILKKEIRDRLNLDPLS